MQTYVIVKSIEIWRNVKNYPYKVSNFGRIKRATPARGTRIDGKLKLNLNMYGYLQVNLYKTGKRKHFFVHRLVAEAFIGPCCNGYEVNHIDGDKTNNYVWNLEYVTRSENVKHSYKLGLQRQDGENNGNSKLKEEDVLKIRNLYKIKNYTQKEIAKKFKVNKATISRIIKRKIWSHI